MTLYHRLAAGRGWWRPLVELVLAVVLWLVGFIIAIEIGVAWAGASDFEQLDTESNLAVTFVGLALAIPATKLAARIVKRPPGHLSSVLGGIRWRWLGRCFAIISLMALAVIGLIFLLALVGVSSDGSSDNSGTWVGLDAFLPAAAMVVVLVPVQATGEEYLFRGTLLQTVGAWMRTPWLAIVLSAVTFGAIHMTNLPATMVLTLNGGILAWLTVRTGGLEAAIAEHAMSNVVIMLASVAFDPEDLGADDLNADVGWEGAISQTVFIAIYAWLVVRRFNRSGLAKGALAVADQVEQHAAKRSGAIEHADHGSNAEALPPEQHEPRG